MHHSVTRPNTAVEWEANLLQPRDPVQDQRLQLYCIVTLAKANAKDGKSKFYIIFEDTTSSHFWTWFCHTTDMAVSLCMWLFNPLSLLVPVWLARHITAGNTQRAISTSGPSDQPACTLQNFPWFTTFTTSEPASHSFPVSRIRKEQSMVTCRQHLVTCKMCRCKHEPCVQVCGDN